MESGELIRVVIFFTLDLPGLFIDLSKFFFGFKDSVLGVHDSALFLSYLLFQLGYALESALVGNRTEKRGLCECIKLTLQLVSLNTHFFNSLIQVLSLFRVVFENAALALKIQIITV